MTAVLAGSTAPARDGRAAGSARPTVEELYDAYADYMWRVVRRLGVAEASAEDAVQEIFLVAFRRLDDFEGRSTVRTWLYGIAIRVARRFRQRGPLDPRAAELSEGLADAGLATPHAEAERGEALRVLARLLSELEPDRREVLVLAEIEELGAPEIAEILGVPVNTVYSRLRLARRDFDDAARRVRARDGWRL